MNELIRLLKGEISSININNGKTLTLLTSRDTEKYEEMGFYIQTPSTNGTYDKTKISNTLGYNLLLNA